MAEIVGGCLCGQVRYSGTAEPMFTGVCHCKDCQKETGTAFNIVVAVSQAALSFQGSPKAYTQKGDSGQDVVRRFCPNCGSTITSEPAAMPGASIIRAGTLDDTSWLKPTMEIYCDSKQPWVSLGSGLQSFARMPQRPAYSAARLPAGAALSPMRRQPTFVLDTRYASAYPFKDKQKLWIGRY